MEKDSPPQLVTPASIKAIISRIEAAQLTRTQEDISSQLSDILDNVNCVVNHFQEELEYDLKEKAKSDWTERKGKNRFILLEKIASFSKDAKAKEKHLYEILHWLGDWGDSLTYELRSRKGKEEEKALDEWIEVMEKVLPLSLIATKGGIESLISLCSTLIERQKKRTQISKHTFWQGWWEQSPPRSASYPQPLSPEQMLQDKHTTCTKVSEVTSMLQELLDSTMFNQGEVRAIRYMSAVVENLNKALTLQHKENCNLETKYRNLEIEMTKELSSQRLYFQNSLQVLQRKRDALLKQVEILGGKYHDLLLIKHALEFQLQKAQSARDQTEKPAKILVDSLGPAEKETLPKKETVMEETQQEPKKEWLFLSLPPGSMAEAWKSGTRPSTSQALSTMTTHSRIADVYSSKDTECLQPVLLSPAGHKFPRKWEGPVAESPEHQVKDQKDFQKTAQEKEGLLIKSHVRTQLSPESSKKVALGSNMEHWEEELSWERQRQQWLEEEAMWLQRQKKWALLEQEHQEKLQQWEMEEAAREQQQRLGQQEKEQGGPWREPERLVEDVDRMIFTPTRRWKDLEKTPLVPPSSRAQSAHQGRRPHWPRSPTTQQPAPRKQRNLSSAKSIQKPWACQVPMKPKKSASSPVTGTAIQKLSRPPLQISPATLKGKVYYMDVEAQRKNLQLLSKESEPGLPHSLRSKALELTTTAMELSALRLHCLCHKYILYRRFQSLRQEVIDHIQIMRETGTTWDYKAQNLYTFLENIDHLQNIWLQAWADKQKDLEEKRRECLSSMVTMFPKLQLEWNIHLHTPMITSPRSRKNKPGPSFLRRTHSCNPSSRQSPEHFTSKLLECMPLRWARHQENQMEAIWRTDVASSSHPVEKRTPPSLPWDQLGGCPDIPQLFFLDVHSSYRRRLQSLKAW